MKTKFGSPILGYLTEYFETGTEGLIWMLEEEGDRSRGLDALHRIEQGDRLTIMTRNGRRTLWSGVIECDTQTGGMPRPGNPEFVQPQALGYWIHWTQRGISPDRWARFFCREDVGRYRGVLEKGLGKGVRLPDST